MHQIQKQYKSKTHSSNSTYSSSGTQFSMPVYIMYTTTASNGKIKKIKGKLKASYYKPVHKREVSGSRPWRKVLVFFFFFFFLHLLTFLGKKYTLPIKSNVMNQLCLMVLTHNSLLRLTNPLALRSRVELELQLYRHIPPTNNSLNINID